MKRLLIILALLSASCSAQMLQAIVGGGASPAAPTTVTYANKFCTFSANATTALCDTSTTIAPGSAVVGVAFTFTTTDPLLTVCDGTGTGQCTGSSTYTIKPVFVNGSQSSYVFFTCNYQGTGGTLTLTQTGTNGLYGNAIVATGNTTTGTDCSDGYAQAQSTSPGTTYTSNTVTTTNSNDLLVGLFTALNGGTFVASVDGKGHSYTLRSANAAVAMIETLEVSATNTYYASATAASSTWNAMILAIK